MKKICVVEDFPANVLKRGFLWPVSHEFEASRGKQVELVSLILYKSYWYYVGNSYRPVNAVAGKFHMHKRGMDGAIFKLLIWKKKQFKSFSFYQVKTNLSYASRKYVPDIRTITI